MNYKYFPTDEEKQIVADLYDGTTLKLNIIMMRLARKYPRWYVKKMAQRMGLARTPGPPNWSPEEEDYLSEHFHHRRYTTIQKALKRINGGVYRSDTAIQLKAKRLGISKSAEGYTLRGLAALLGCDHHAIERWMARALLAGRRRGTKRKACQGGDMWYFRPEDVCTFIVNNPDEIDLRRVEKTEFITLLAGGREMSVTCRCPRCGGEHEMAMHWTGRHIPRKYCPACRAAATDDGESCAIGEL